MKRSDLLVGDCPDFYRAYLDTLPEEAELLKLLARQWDNFPQFIESIPGELWGHRYEPDKWSVVEVLVHLIDAERVFQYRSLRFGRKDATPLPGFEHTSWVPHSNSEFYSKDTYIAAYRLVRSSTLQLFETFSEEDLKWRGTASEARVSLGAIGYIICGHQRHHRNILRSRYLGG